MGNTSSAAFNLYFCRSPSLHIEFTLLAAVVSMTFTLFSDKTGIRRTRRTKQDRPENELYYRLYWRLEKEREGRGGEIGREREQGTCIE